jgi:DUF971 family protein
MQGTPMPGMDSDAGGEAGSPQSQLASWPKEIRLNAEKTALQISFENGVSATLDSEMLRVLSPSAEVQGHSPSERKTVAGKCGVTIRDIEAVGHYAVKLVFSDGHATGIYSWDYLMALSLNKESLWRDYLESLAAKGLSRDAL